MLGNQHRLEAASRTIQNRILMLDTEISSKKATIERDCGSVRGQLGQAELSSLGQSLQSANDVFSGWLYVLQRRPEHTRALS